MLALPNAEHRRPEDTLGSIGRPFLPVVRLGETEGATTGSQRRLAALLARSLSDEIDARALDTIHFHIADEFL